MRTRLFRGLTCQPARGRLGREITPLLSTLNITNFRNLRDARIEGLARHNIICGENGSGKTSLLECAHILGTARSFRSGGTRTLISHDQDAFTVQGVCVCADRGVFSRRRSLGVQRDRAGSVLLRVAGETVSSASFLADELPLLVLNSDSFDLLTGEPANRRRFLDWGVFHVEHQARAHRQRFQRALRQRNHLLRHGSIGGDQLVPWTRELVECGEHLAAARQRFADAIAVAFKPFMESLAPELGDVELSYRRGWSNQQGYAEALRESEPSDRAQGFTQRGPQRADIRFAVAGHSAADTLSRGQQKLLICALKLAQGQILCGQGCQNLLYLVDDLPAELDEERCERVCRQLAAIRAQTIITSIDPAHVPPHWFVGPDSADSGLMDSGLVDPGVEAYGVMGSGLPGPGVAALDAQEAGSPGSDTDPRLASSVASTQRVADEFVSEEAPAMNTEGDTDNATVAVFHVEHGSVSQQ